MGSSDLSYFYFPIYERKLKDMKYIILSIALMVAGVQLLTAQEVPDSLARDDSARQITELNEKLAGFESKLTDLRGEISALETDLQQLVEKQSGADENLTKLSQRVNRIASQINGITKETEDVRTSVEDLGNKTDELETSLQSSNESLNVKIVEAKDTADSAVTNLKSRTVWGVVIAAVILILLLIAVYWLGRRSKKATSTVDNVRKAQEAMQETVKKMQEESVKLDSELLELLDKQAQSAPTAASGAEVDHSLTLKVADEIVRIEMNLSRMDSEIKGYKQLKKAVERIKDNFKANGYEIVDMLGKPYNDGMKVIANFVPDETLAEGEQIITGIIKPQINYNGKMIQAAQITVSQNI